MSDEREKEMFTTEQAAKELGISVPTFRRLLASGKIEKPPSNEMLQRPRRLFFDAAQIRALKAGNPPAPSRTPDTPKQSGMPEGADDKRKGG